MKNSIPDPSLCYKPLQETCVENAVDCLDIEHGENTSNESECNSLMQGTNEECEARTLDMECSQDSVVNFEFDVSEECVLHEYPSESSVESDNTINKCSMKLKICKKITSQFIDCETQTDNISRYSIEQFVNKP